MDSRAVVFVVLAGRDSLWAVGFSRLDGYELLSLGKEFSVSHSVIVANRVA